MASIIYSALLDNYSAIMICMVSSSVGIGVCYLMGSPLHTIV